ncbi:vWA domain-containing protein [Pseudooceanicola sp.]|uniref:vWA domain-containing protein n=1 Tax=Pseudooceanicola sp. TaxID=1914328 RepID=UPI002611B927|nr:vWA domain-containing protein [Pseudooceanicola sp.]MDF1857116.1 VWA domain-containing protein [Pseudooceanicola sp.]
MHRPFAHLAPGLAALSLSLTAAPPAPAMPGCAADAMLVFDGSASMAEIGFDQSEATRIEEARRALAQVMPGIAALRRIGLLIYGPGGTTACSGFDLRFAPIAEAATPVVDAVAALRPDGLTPLTAAVQAAAEVLAYRSSPGLVVLVTDGNETCGGHPCALGQALAEDGADLVVHVIGFRASVDYWTWNNPEQRAGADSVARCLADKTGGTFVRAETLEELVEAMRSTLGCPLIGGLGRSLTATAKLSGRAPG